ncbi:grasp-with-spasm system SPASM domain peptide maturase [Williamwhitmania taraxaci]|uniref:SPASM domain peptide maturase, grasp-with-spasm system n=1 Tax=Williamwhitmania taraxaci TaxID=1640674 RepID=A0A1G6S1E2_9BACT|nr:grasp-with-spasm system SPASM domain peptide maturase [Williamwhitmania taraxaci]SDD09996.1 SPASM domain peptide maturase, grasp-with-spasm system [Williamwhitmania taraxaci]
MEKKLKFFEECRVVKGYSRSAIYELLRNRYKLIPNSLADLLLTCDGMSVVQIKKYYENKYDDTIDEYIDFLLENEFVFFTDDFDCFPPLNLEWHSNSKISNAVICDNNSEHNYDYLFERLEEYNCRAIQFRFFHKCSKIYLSDIFEKLKHSRLTLIEVILPFNSDLDVSDYRDIVLGNMRVSSFYIHSAPKDGVEFVDKEKLLPLYFSKDKIVDNSFCGFIHPRNFRVSMGMFCESQGNNSCLNRKLSIDEKGKVKNCPSMTNSFGVLNDKELDKIVEDDLFKYWWTKNKSIIQVCRDCEFRFMCLDCRAYIVDDNDVLSMPRKCGYNPYVAKWAGQDGFVSVESWLQKNGS